MTDRSSVLTALHVLYDHHPEAQWSWMRLNHALQAQLSCLITVGATFQLDDFCTLAADRRLAFGYWSGEDAGERFYAAAVEANNRSACHAFEHWKQRPPYIWEGQRLRLGDQLRWQGESVTLTSFAADGSAITLCSYKPLPEGTTCPTCRSYCRPYARSKVLHRYTVTVAMLHEADPTRQATKVKKKTSVTPGPSVAVGE